MSFAWAFYSVSGPKFENHFVGPHPEKLEYFVAALTWDGSLDDDDAQRVAEHIANRGLEYSDLTESEAELVDRSIPLLTSEEGLGTDLDRRPESPEFVQPSVIESLLRAANASGTTVPLLPVLRSGRRYGDRKPTPECNYCLLSPVEAGELAAELTAILSATDDWGNETWMTDLVEKCLVKPLAKAAGSNRPLLGLLG